MNRSRNILTKHLFQGIFIGMLALLSLRTGVAEAGSVSPNCGTWSIVSSPNASSDNYFDGVAAISANDVWAVGTSTQPFSEHWNGSAWSIVSGPTIGGSFGGVAAVSSNDVWAVGADPNGTLTEHWNGSQWSIVPNPGSFGYLNAVTAIATNDVWAVGYGTNSQALTEHWDGTQWSIVPSPGNSTVALYGIAAVSSNDVWTVGDGFNGKTLIEHWDGTQWSIVSSPNQGTFDHLQGVVAIASNDVWAVGTKGVNQVTTLIEHWDGSKWSIVSSPNPGKLNDLGGVVAIASNDVWAVGGYRLPFNRHYNTLVEHWDGTSWSIVASPTPRNSGGFSTLARVPGTSQLWAVGAYRNHGRNTDNTLTEFYC